MTPDRRRGSAPRDLRKRIADLERATGSPVPADMAPSEFANAYLAGDLAIPADAVDGADDERVYLWCFGMEEENIGGITIPRAAILDCFDPEADFPI